MKQTRILLMMIVIAALLSGCEDDGPEIDVESSIPVRVEPVALGSINEYVFATGTVAAVDEANFKAMQSGYYRPQINPRTGRDYAMGDAVKAGDVLVSLFNPEVENSVAFDSKKLNFEISKREFEKQKGLHEKGGITLRELTDSERMFIDARYAYDNARLQLAKLQVVALFDGILVDLPFYSNNQLVETGSMLARVMDYTRLYAELALPGRELSRVTRGLEAVVTGYTGSDDTLTGVVTEVSPTLDPNSRMFKLNLEIENDSLVFRPGMFVKVDIVVEQKDSTVVIPKETIQDRRGTKVVFVVEKGIAVQRTLELGLSNRDFVEVLSGLQEDDRLVVEGFETLRNRSKVKITK
ncbi:MAG: efflux RND transporter periplasmic adaptor subunit [candidate division Zixibacteria bacterium]